MDLSLPAKAPSPARIHEEPPGLLPTALYTLVDLFEDGLRRSQEDCESWCIETGKEPDESVQVAPRARFVGQPLRAVFDYHVELVANELVEFDPDTSSPSSTRTG